MIHNRGSLDEQISRLHRDHVELRNGFKVIPYIPRGAFGEWLVEANHKIMQMRKAKQDGDQGGSRDDG